MLEELASGIVGNRERIVLKELGYVFVKLLRVLRFAFVIDIKRNVPDK